MYRRSNMKETAVLARAKQTLTLPQQRLEDSSNPRVLRDNHNRVRSITVGFRVSPEQNEKINMAAAISGLPKQEYCYRRCLCQDVVVHGNPRVYIALKEHMENILVQLKRIVSVDEVTPELLETIDLIAVVMDGMKKKGEENEKNWC